MRSVTKISKVLQLITLNVAFLAIGAVLSLFPGKAWRMRARASCMQVWARISCLIMGVKISASGTLLMQRGSIVVANHCSYLDILVLGSLIPGVFVAKKEISSWFLAGPLAGLAGTVFVDRSSKMSTRHSISAIGYHLAHGMNVIFFPEGTTNNGREMLDFKSSFFQIPVDSGRHVVPVSISYDRIECGKASALPEDMIAWYGDMDLLPHFWNVLGASRIHVRIKWHEVLNRPENSAPSIGRKQLALHAYQSVRSGCESMRTA